MTQLDYAGIGSRATPPEDTPRYDPHGRLARAPRLASSTPAGRRGADSAFAAGAPGRAPHRLPAVARILRLRRAGLPHPLAASHAAPASPSPPICIPRGTAASPAARNLHARNTAILLGEDAATPVHAVVAWTVGGAVRGGTGQGIRIAHRYGIPALNLGSMHPRAVCERLEEIRAAPHPPPSPSG